MVEPISAERFGRYFENAIGARLVEAGWDTYYWKHRKHEVDFVVIGPNNEKWAIEVKTTETSLEELRGVFEFCEQYNEFESCLLSLVHQKFDGLTSLDPSDVLSLHRP